jgi:hypothetical protein
MIPDFSPAVMEKYSPEYATAKNMDRFDLSSTDDRYVLTFKGNLETMLISSKSILAAIRYQNYCMMPSVDAKRQFVGDDLTAVAQLNVVLTVLDRTEKDLRESEARRRSDKERAGELAENLKKTRTLFGSKEIATVRRSLESMATAQ